MDNHALASFLLMCNEQTETIKQNLPTFIDCDPTANPAGLAFAAQVCTHLEVLMILIKHLSEENMMIMDKVEEITSKLK